MDKAVSEAWALLVSGSARASPAASAPRSPSLASSDRTA